MKTHTFIILSTFLVTSCRSHRETSVTSTIASSGTATESVDTRRDSGYGLRLYDSCALSLDSPHIEILRPDSTLVRLTATRITVASQADLRLEHSDTIRIRHVAQSHVGTSAHAAAHTDRRVEAASMPRWLWPAVVTASILILWFVRKYIRQ